MVINYKFSHISQETGSGLKLLSRSIVGNSGQQWAADRKMVATNMTAIYHIPSYQPNLREKREKLSSNIRKRRRSGRCGIVEIS